MSTITDRPTSADLFERCREAGDKLRELRSLPADKRGETYEADRRAASVEVTDLDREFENTRQMERYELELLAFERGAQVPEARGGEAAGADVGDADMRAPGDIFVESEAYKNRRDGVNEARSNSENVEVRNLLTGTSIGTSGSHAFVPVGSPFLAPQAVQQRRLFVRDLLSVQSTGLNSVPYIRELNGPTNETGAATVSEASAKPEVTMQFTTVDAPIRKIAAWIQVTMEALEDAPTLSGYINTRLAYMLLLEEEDQVLQGDGNAPNLQGIIGATGVQTQTATNNDVPATVADSAAKIELKDGMADGIVMNPGDFWASVSERRTTTFDGEAVSTPPFGTPPPNLWGFPVVRSRTLASLTSLVGSFRLGATLFERSGVTIRTSDSHASLFVSNTVVVLAEERVGLAIHRPDWFVTTTLDITA